MSTIPKSLALALIIISFAFVPHARAATDFKAFPDLKLGDASPFVTKIQKVLNLNGFTINSQIGQPGSQGFETSKFGGLTEKALSSFQSSHGITPASGMFGQKTKAKLTELSQSKKLVEVSAGKPVAYGSDTCSSIVHYGITWTFSSPKVCGQFANGEWWVVGPVSITNISPNGTNLTPGQAVLGSNGSMINPILGQRQGFDSRIDSATAPGRTDALYYDPAKNVAKSFPFTVNAGDMLLSSRAGNGYPAKVGDSYLQTLAALTVVATPPPEGSFRPSIYGTSHPILWNVSQIDWSYLKNFSAPAATPAKATIESDMPALPWFEWVGVWDGNIIQPVDNTDHGYQYGRETAEKFGRVGLWLNTNQSFADKKAIAIQMIQNGIDIYDYVRNYPNPQQAFYHDGGHKVGRKLPLVMAAAMLNDNSLKAMAATNNIFQEDTQTWFVTQADVGRRVGDYPGYSTSTYQQSDVGMAEWGIRHKWEPFSDNRTWITGYRHVVFPATAGPVLAAELMGMKSAWNHDPLFAYLERYYSISGIASKAFFNQMYAYKTGGNQNASIARLTVTTSGSGVVTATGINCGTDCTEDYTIANNTSVTLTAVPTSPALFTGWSGGGCSGTGTCTVSMGANTSVSATFAVPAIPFAIGNRIAVTNANSDSVNVRNDTVIDPSTLVGTQANGNTGTIACGPVTTGGTTWWTIDFDSGADGWSGQNNLTVISAGTYGGALSCGGGTPQVVKYTLTASKNGTGTGFINGINSASTDFDASTTVTLTAEAAAGSTFAGWSGACTGSSLSCTISMTSDKNITATFNLTQSLTSPTITSPSTGSIIAASTTARVTWNSTGSAYLTRIQDQTPTPGTIIQNNNQTGLSESFTVIPGHAYKFWIHSGTLGNYSTPQTEVAFTVATSSVVVVQADEDSDGIADTGDKCLGTPVPVRSAVNSYGCPVPIASNVSIKNDVDSADITNISNLEIEDKNAAYGKIKYSQPINMFGTGDKKSQVNIDSIISITNKRVSVNSSAAPQFNKPATVTVYNVNYVRPMIVKDSTEVYATSSSPIMTYNPTTKVLTFTVNGFSTYDIVEGASTYTLTASKSGTGNGSIVGIESATTTFIENTIVTLTAVAGAGSTFGGWSGACIGTGACLVAMQSNKSVDASFVADSVAPVNTSAAGGSAGGSAGGGSAGGSNAPGAYVNPNNTGLGTPVVNGTVNTNTTTASYTFVKDLKVFARDQEVVKLQRFLNARGYTVASKGAGSPGFESTYFGPATQVALAKFQRDNKIIPASGFFGKLTKELINKAGGTTAVTPVSSTATYALPKNLGLYAKDASVIQLQKFLNGKGYTIATKGQGSPGLESTYFGLATKNALIRFQIKNGIKATGLLDPATRTLINSGKGV